MENRPLYEVFRSLPRRIQLVVAMLVVAAVVPAVLHVLALGIGSQTGILGLIGRHPWLMVVVCLALGIGALVATLTSGTHVESVRDVWEVTRDELRSATPSVPAPSPDEEEPDA